MTAEAWRTVVWVATLADVLATHFIHNTGEQHMADLTVFVTGDATGPYADFFSDNREFFTGN